MAQAPRSKMAELIKLPIYQDKICLSLWFEEGVYITL